MPTGFWRSGNFTVGKRIHLDAIQTGVTAATGSSQATGVAITGAVCVIATCANAGDAVTLPIVEKGAMIYVRNNGAASADVFPAVGTSGVINGGSADAAAAVANATGALFICVDVSSAGVATWITI